MVNKHIIETTFILSDRQLEMRKIQLHQMQTTILDPAQNQFINRVRWKRQIKKMVRGDNTAGKLSLSVDGENNCFASAENFEKTCSAEPSVKLGQNEEEKS